MMKQIRAALPLILILAIVVGILAISLSYLYNAVQASVIGNSEQALYFALLGATGIGISLYTMYVVRKRIVSQKPLPKIITTTECKKCGFRSLRKFEKGDYVFKSVGSCQNCNEPTLITSIYTEEAKKKGARLNIEHHKGVEAKCHG